MGQTTCLTTQARFVAFEALVLNIFSTGDDLPSALCAMVAQQCEKGRPRPTRDLCDGWGSTFVTTAWGRSFFRSGVCLLAKSDEKPGLQRVWSTRIRFIGTFSTFKWTEPLGENYHALTYETRTTESLERGFPHAGNAPTTHVR